MWYTHKFFKIGTGILLSLLIIFLIGKIEFFLAPLRRVVATVLIPILATGFFYYILRPVVRLLEKYKVPKTLAILIGFITVVILAILAGTYAGSIIADQFNQFKQFTQDISKGLESTKQNTSFLFDDQWWGDSPLKNFEQKLTTMLGDLMAQISNFASGFFTVFLSTITNVGTIALLVPFMLFYFLKDDKKIVAGFLQLVPKKHKFNGKKIMEDVDKALASYILGQMTVALADGALTFIGYSIIGLPNALFLALVTVITCMIPFFGPWIGIIPAILKGMTQEPWMALKVLIVMLTVQQLDGAFISPQVIGKNLKIHPVTVILLLMAGLSLFGLAGIIITIPLYAALRITIKNIYIMYWQPSREN